MVRDREKEEHESYGTIGFYRTQGDPGKMFGSALPQHGHFVALSIKRAIRYHDLHQDWIHGGEELINIWLSANQFAELLTTMNVGDGVPCTLKRVAGKGMEPPPDTESTEAERISTGFDDRLNDFADTLQEKTDLACEMLRAQGTINKGARKHVADILEWVHREVRSNLPFALTSFQEAVDKTSQHAKAELDAMVTHVVQKTGLKAIAEGMAPALPPAKDEDVEG